MLLTFCYNFPGAIGEDIELLINLKPSLMAKLSFGLYPSGIARIPPSPTIPSNDPFLFEKPPSELPTCSSHLLGISSLISIFLCLNITYFLI